MEYDPERTYDNCFTVDLAKYGSKGKLLFVLQYNLSSEMPDYSRVVDIRR
jgi:hypothetical protein